MYSIPTAANTSKTFNRQQMIFHPNVYVMGRRIVATWLDFIPLGTLIWFVDSTFGVNHYLSSISPAAGISYASSTAVALPWLYLVMVMYYTVQEALFGATIGKLLMGLKVVQNDGRPVMFTRTFVRNIVRPIDATSGYLLGWILALCSSRRRRLGDHLAGTLVVSADSVPPLANRQSHPRLALCSLVIICALFVAFCLGFDYYGRPPLVIEGLTNGNAAPSIFTNHGSILDLTLSQPRWENNTVTYAIIFQAHLHGKVSSCRGNITLAWPGFLSGWQFSSGNTICNSVEVRH